MISGADRFGPIGTAARAFAFAIIALAVASCGNAGIAGSTSMATASQTTPVATKPDPRPANLAKAAQSRLAAEPLPPESLPGWQADTDLRTLSAAIDRQCAMKSPPVPWPTLCGEWRTRTGDPRAWIGERFVAWPLLGADDQALGLLTGYYEPLLRGSMRREAPTQAPLYRRPGDLLRIDIDGQGQRYTSSRPPLRGRLDGDRIVPYYSRLEIESAQPLQGQELLWIDDPVDAFFLQIQGSGRVRLRDERVIRVGFAEHNGQPYRAIGRDLIDRGALRAEDVNAASIKAWLRANRDVGVEIMRSNPRYIFFHELPPMPDDAGPPGSLGVPLTALRSIATDPRRVPAGALMYLDSRFPVSGEPLQRLVLNQDTGAAIVGPVRADLFWGFGDEAERRASMTRERARLWLLWPKDASRPSLGD